MNAYKPPSDIAQLQVAPNAEAAGQSAREITGYSPPKKRMSLNPVRLVGGFAASVVTGIALGKLIDGPLRPETHNFDGWLLDATRAVQHKPLDPVMAALSNLGEPAVLYPVSGVFAAGWLIEREPEKSAAMALAVAGSAAIDRAIKSVVKRPRPFLKLPLPRTRPSGSSFPSNHALMSFATYGAIAVLASRKRKPKPKSEANVASSAPNDGHQVTKKRKVASVFRAALLVLPPVALLVGWSRVYRGVHNPSDVIAGWLIGSIWLAACTSAATQPGVDAQE
jgi:undecaprenyl-diphosphatase